MRVHEARKEALIRNQISCICSIISLTACKVMHVQILIWLEYYSTKEEINY